jgi:predicted nuclease of predicted toxin-antitoxin system
MSSTRLPPVLPMNLLADESVDWQIVQALRSEGHDVLYVAEIEPSATDIFVLEQSRQLAAILLTADDFGELVFRQGLATAGVVLVRLAGLSAQVKASTVCDAFRQHEAEMCGAFTVISPGLLRVRRRIAP